MRLSARLNLALSVAVIAFAAACGSDSTGPKTPTAAQVAAHFDSIAIQANAQSETNSAYEARSLLATLIELPAAFGAVPSTVKVTTADGTEDWKAYELLDIPSGASSDSTFFLLAFRDADAHTAVLITFDGDGTGNSGGIITGDTINVNPTDASATTTLSSVTSSCGAISSTLLNPQLSTVSFDTCNLATFTTSMSLTLPATTGMDAALTSVSFSNSSVHGARVVDQTAGASLRRAVAMFHSAKAYRHR